MQIYSRTASAITLDRNGLALAQTPAGAGALTLTAATTLSPARKVSIYSGSNIAARVFTVTGTDRKGNAITDTVTGVNNSTVSTTKVFATVTSITVDAGTGADVEAGWTAVSYTSWIILGNPAKLWTLRAFFAATGTANYDIEGTSQNLIRDGVTGEHPDDLITLAAAQTGNYTSYNETPLAAVRLKVNSQDVDVTLRVIPSGYST
jgi:hypothetical protein